MPSEQELAAIKKLILACRAFHEVRTRTKFDCPEMWAAANRVSDAINAIPKRKPKRRA